MRSEVCGQVDWLQWIHAIRDERCGDDQSCASTVARLLARGDAQAIVLFVKVLGLHPLAI